MKQKILHICNILFVVFFLMVLFINHLQQNTQLFQDVDSTEKRTLSNCPSLLKSSNDSFTQYLKNLAGFPKSFESCFSDNFVLRSTFIENLNTLRMNKFDIATSQRVIKGSDDWYEFQDELAKGYLQGGFTPGEIEYWYNKLLARQKYYESKGIKYYTFIAPMKINFLKDKFATHYTNFPETGAIQLDNLNKQKGNNLNLVLFHKAIRKNPEAYYFKSDFHWNFEGGYEAYKVMYNYLSEDGVKMIKIEKDECEKESVPLYIGDLAIMMGINLSEREKIADKNSYSYSCGSQNVPFDKIGDTYGNLPQKSFSNNTPELDNAIILRDSYAIYTAPFLRASFNSTKMIYSPSFFENNAFEIIEEDKPDVVIQLFVESNMRRGTILNNSEIDVFELK